MFIFVTSKWPKDFQLNKYNNKYSNVIFKAETDLAYEDFQNDEDVSYSGKLFYREI